MLDPCSQWKALNVCTLFHSFLCEIQSAVCKLSVKTLIVISNGRKEMTSTSKYHTLNPGLFTDEHPSFSHKSFKIHSTDNCSYVLCSTEPKFKAGAPSGLINFSKLLFPIRELVTGFNKLLEEFISVIPALLDV